MRLSITHEQDNGMNVPGGLTYVQQTVDVNIIKLMQCKRQLDSGMIQDH